MKPICYTFISITWYTTTGSFRLKTLNMFEFSVEEKVSNNRIWCWFWSTLPKGHNKPNKQKISRSTYCLKFVLLLAMVKQAVSHVPSTLSRGQLAAMLSRVAQVLPRSWSVSCTFHCKVNDLTYMAQHLSQMFPYT